MGITIHYNGCLNDNKLINTIINDLKEISNKMNYEYTILNEDLTKPNTSFLNPSNNIVEIKGHLPLKGIIINFNKKCDPLFFLFDNNGNLQDPVIFAMNNGLENNNSQENYLAIKTQYSSPEIHIIIIKLLQYIKDKYISNLIVIDEGNYFETNDKKLLEEKFKFLKTKIDSVTEILSKTEKSYEDEIPLFLIQKIENILKEKLKK